MGHTWQELLVGAAGCPELVATGSSELWNQCEHPIVCQAQQHAAPLEQQLLLPGGKAGREILLGRLGEGEATDAWLEVSSWKEALRPKWVPFWRSCGHWWPVLGHGHCWGTVAMGGPWWVLFFSKNQSSVQKLALSGNELSKNFTSWNSFACIKKLQRRAYEVAQFQHAAVTITYSLHSLCHSLVTLLVFPVISSFFPFLQIISSSWLGFVGFPFVFKAELTSSIHHCAAASQLKSPIPSLNPNQTISRRKDLTSSQRKGSIWEEVCLAALETWDLVWL